MVSRIPISEVKARLDDLVARVTAGEEFLVVSGGKDVCRIGPPKARAMTGADFAALLQSLPKPDEAFGDEVEAAARNQPQTPDTKWE